MKMNGMLIIGACAALFALSSCKDDAPQEPRLVFKFRFDSTQVRLNAIGQESVMPSDHRAQHPSFEGMSAHYIELAPNAYTALGTGAVIYLAPETSAGGSNAIDFNQSVIAGEGDVFFSIPLKDVAPGTYEWIRVSLAFQKYSIKYRISPPAAPLVIDGVGTLASFIGYNTYITTYNVNTMPVSVNGNKPQGYWAFESYGQVVTGQVPAGLTTVPNPIFNTSPIPQGSCVVTASFSSPLQVTGTETDDINVTISLSVNNSFEWVEHGGNNLFEPLNGDTVVDMGIRGMIPVIE